MEIPRANHAKIPASVGHNGLCPFMGVKGTIVDVVVIKVVVEMNGSMVVVVDVVVLLAIFS